MPKQNKTCILECQKYYFQCNYLIFISIAFNKSSKNVAKCGKKRQKAAKSGKKRQKAAKSGKKRQKAAKSGKKRQKAAKSGKKKARIISTWIHLS